MKLGTYMPDGERRNPIDIEVCMIKVKVTTSYLQFSVYIIIIFFALNFDNINKNKNQ
jgi:hypothetical protein